MSTLYRPDIDGLRALAVIPVMLFHAGVSGFGGGFTGVDVFFVISGFLITRLLRDGLEAGTFSLAGFYDRRIRRIVPVLLVVTLTTACDGGRISGESRRQGPITPVPLAPGTRSSRLSS